MADVSSGGGEMSLEQMQVAAAALQSRAAAVRAVAHEVFNPAHVSLATHYQDAYGAVLDVTDGWKGSAAQAGTAAMFDHADASSSASYAARASGNAVADLADKISTTLAPKTPLTTPPPAEIDYNKAMAAVNAMHGPGAAQRFPGKVQQVNLQAWSAYDTQSSQAQDQLQKIVNAANTAAAQQQGSFAPIAAPPHYDPDALPVRVTPPAFGSGGSSGVGGASGSYSLPAGGRGVSHFAPPHGDAGAPSVVAIPRPVNGGSRGAGSAGAGGHAGGGAASSHLGGSSAGDPSAGRTVGSPPATAGPTYPSDESDFLPPSAWPAASGSQFAPPGDSALNWGAVAAGAAGAAVLGAGGNLGHRAVANANPGAGSGADARSGAGEGSAGDGVGGDVDEWPRLPAAGSGGAGSGGQPSAGVGAGGSGSGYASGSGSDGSVPPDAGEAGPAAAGEMSAAERAGLYPPMGGVRRRDDEEDEITHNPDWMVEVNIFGTIRRVAPPTIGAPETFRNAGEE